MDFEPQQGSAKRLRVEEPAIVIDDSDSDSVVVDDARPKTALRFCYDFKECLDCKVEYVKNSDSDFDDSDSDDSEHEHDTPCGQAALRMKEIVSKMNVIMRTGMDDLSVLRSKQQTPRVARQVLKKYETTYASVSKLMNIAVPWLFDRFRHAGLISPGFELGDEVTAKVAGFSALQRRGSSVADMDMPEHIAPVARMYFAMLLKFVETGNEPEEVTIQRLVDERSTSVSADVVEHRVACAIDAWELCSAQDSLYFGLHWMFHCHFKAMSKP